MKHFKNEPRGKRRLHKKPDTSEIDACRWWLDNELELIEPAVAVALGATAARALMRKALAINANRGRLSTCRTGAMRGHHRRTRLICSACTRSATSGASSISWSRICTWPPRPRARREAEVHGGSAQKASAPISPVRTRIAPSSGSTKTLPSPICPVRAALPSASTTLSASAALDGDLELHLRHILHGVFGAAIDLGLALLPAEPAHLAHRQPLHADIGKRLAHGLEPVRLNHCNDIFHVARPRSHVVAALAVEPEIEALFLGLSAEA